MPDIVFPPSSAPGPRLQESAGRLINAFTEKAPVGAASDMIWRRTPGLLRVAEAPIGVHTRGFLDCGAVVLWALNDKLYSFDSSFAVSPATGEPFAGVLPITVARNNASPAPQNLAVTENGLFNLPISGPPTPLADIDLPANPTSVSFMDGYFLLTYGSGQVWASELNQTQFMSNSFGTEQGLFIRRGFVHGGRFYAFGDKWTAVYRNAGTSPFPLAKEVTIPRGIIGTHAVAGSEVGWSNTPIFVGDDFIVYALAGYTTAKISNDDVSRDIQAAALAGDGGLLEASTHMYGGHAMWSLTYPNNWTWEFNLTTQQWHEKRSYNEPDWRGRRSVRAFNRWLIGDKDTGRLMQISGEYFLEDVDPLIWQVDSGAVSAFPQGIALARASFNMTAGVGAFPLVDDPKVMISWSLDGGHTFGTPLLRRLGGPGQTKWYPEVRSLGLSRGQGARFRLVVSDPVHVALAGGVVDAEPRGP